MMTLLGDSPITLDHDDSHANTLHYLDIQKREFYMISELESCGRESRTALVRVDTENCS